MTCSSGIWAWGEGCLRTSPLCLAKLSFISSWMSCGLLLLQQEVGEKGPDRLFNRHQGTGRNRDWDWWRNNRSLVQPGAFHGSGAGKASGRAVMDMQASGCPAKQCRSVLYQDLRLQEEFFPISSSVEWISWLGQVTWHAENISTVLASMPQSRYVLGAT